MFPEIVLPDEVASKDRDKVNLDANNKIIYQDNLYPYQRDFHKSEAKFRRIDGGVGGGKSICATVEAIKESWMYPDNFGYILRKTLPQIRISALPTFYKCCPKWMVFEHNRSEFWVDIINRFGFDYMEKLGYRPSANKLRQVDGLSRIQFISFEMTREGFEKFASSEPGWYFVEQAEQANFEMYKKLNERLRRNPASRKAWFVSNPIQGRDWLWQIFDDYSPSKFPNHEQFHVKTYDNVVLADDYIQQMELQYTDEEKDIFLQGTIGGIPRAIYPELDPTIHLLEDFKIPVHWDKAIGLDHGLHNPTAAILLARDEFGNIYAYDEYYQNQKRVSDHARALLPKLTMNHKCKMIDPSTSTRDGVHLDTVKGEYVREGLFFRSSSRDIPAGINRISEYLKVDPKRKHPITGATGSPRLFILEKCKTLWEEMTIYRYEELKTGIGESNLPDKPLKHRDHTCDALRYAMMGFAIPLSKKSDAPDSPHREMFLNSKPMDNVNTEGNMTIEKEIKQAIKPRRIQTTSWLAA